MYVCVLILYKYGKYKDDNESVILKLYVLSKHEQDCHLRANEWDGMRRNRTVTNIHVGE
jgi:hypothetical protein